MRSSVFLRILTSTDSSALIHNISPRTNLHRNNPGRSGLRNSLNIYEIVGNKCSSMRSGGNRFAASKELSRVACSPA